MAVDAGTVEDTGVSRTNADRFVKILERERLGMPEAVFGFDEILGNKVVRGVAIVAAGHRVVAGLLPAVILLAHDVAIHARGGIAAEVRGARGVVKSETSQPGAYSDKRV